jgi:hypothetical protein
VLTMYKQLTAQPGSILSAAAGALHTSDAEFIAKMKQHAGLNAPD